MVPMTKPIEFRTSLSEAEVRLTLKGICGSVLYDDPFRGTVERNSFTLLRNSVNPFCRIRRSSILHGTFEQQADGTRVVIRGCDRNMEFIGRLFYSVFVLFISVFTFVSNFSDGWMSAMAISLLLLSFATVWVALDYLFFRIEFRYCLKKVKKALEME